MGLTGSKSRLVLGVKGEDWSIFMELSEELLIHILRFLDIDSLNQFGGVDHYFNQVVRSETSIWRKKFLELCPSFPYSLTGSTDVTPVVYDVLEGLLHVQKDNFDGTVYYYLCKLMLSHNLPFEEFYGFSPTSINGEKDLSVKMILDRLTDDNLWIVRDDDPSVFMRKGRDYREYKSTDRWTMNFLLGLHEMYLTPLELLEIVQNYYINHDDLFKREMLVNMIMCWILNFDLNTLDIHQAWGSFMDILTPSHRDQIFHELDLIEPVVSIIEGFEWLDDMEQRDWLEVDTLMDMQVPPEIFAEQFSIFLESSLSNIHYTEFLHMIWWIRQPTQAINITRDTVIFNNFSYYLCGFILQSERVDKAITYLIDLAYILLNEEHCVGGAFMIYQALNRASIHRLNSKIKLKQKTIQKRKELESLLDSTSNYRALRKYMKEHEGSAIPFIGMYLTDIVFITEGSVHQDFNLRIAELIYRTIYPIIQLDRHRFDDIDPSFLELFIEGCHPSINNFEEKSFNHSLKRFPRSP